MEIFQQLLPYADALQQRDLASIDLIVIHCTELPDLATARQYGEAVHYPTSGTGNSGHYYVDRDGRCEQWVPNYRIANHVRGHNARAIGVELVNSGRWPDWYHAAHQQPEEAYPVQQIDHLIELIGHLRSSIPSISLLAGHADLDRQTMPSADDPEILIQRKIDPGPLFPWSIVTNACGMARWSPN